MTLLTNILQKFLEDVLTGKFKREDDPHKYNVYMKRIQNRLDDGFPKLLWLAENFSHLLKDEEKEFDDPNLPRHRRLKILLKVIKALNPASDVELTKLKREALNK